MYHYNFSGLYITIFTAQDAVNQ